jgi:hypothetical protein
LYTFSSPSLNSLPHSRVTPPQNLQEESFASSSSPSSSSAAHFPVAHTATEVNWETNSEGDSLDAESSDEKPEIQLQSSLSQSSFPPDLSPTSSPSEFSMEEVMNYLSLPLSIPRSPSVSQLTQEERDFGRERVRVERTSILSPRNIPPPPSPTFSSPRSSI